MKLRYLASYLTPFLVLGRKVKSLLVHDGWRGVRVLIFHDIHISKLVRFRELMHYLAPKYRFLTPLEFEQFVQGTKHISGLNLLVTFDDGFKSNRLAAQEVLEPLGIKGIFFVPTELINLEDIDARNKFISQYIYRGGASNYEILTDQEALSWGDLGYLIRQGHTIGCHTKNHQRLTEIDDQAELKTEIIDSGNILEKKLGVPIKHFAYPLGDINSINKEAMSEIKQRYKYCFSGIRGMNYFPVSTYAIFRDALDLDDPLIYVRFIIERGLDVLYQKKQKKLLELAK